MTVRPSVPHRGSVALQDADDPVGRRVARALDA